MIKPRGPAPPRTIVGVVGDVRHQGLDRPLGPQVYVPQSQSVWAETLMTLVVRSTGEPTALAGAVRGVVREVDSTQPVTDVASATPTWWPRRDRDPTVRRRPPWASSRRWR